MSENITILDDIQEKDFEKASKGRRFANSLLDSIFYIIIFMIVMFNSGNPTPSEGGGLFYNLIGYGILFTYYILMEGVWGVTMGKLITGTKVVDINGNKPQFSTVIIRSLCRFIPFDAISFLGERGWHDSISKTMVVRK